MCGRRDTQPHLTPHTLSRTHTSTHTFPHCQQIAHTLEHTPSHLTVLPPKAPLLRVVEPLQPLRQPLRELGRFPENILSQSHFPFLRRRELGGAVGLPLGWARGGLCRFVRPSIGGRWFWFGVVCGVTSLFRSEDVAGRGVAQNALENFLGLRFGRGADLRDRTDAAKWNL